LADAEGDRELLFQVGRDSLAIPDGAHETDGRWFVAEHPVEVCDLARGKARWAFRPLVIGESLESVGSGGR
jgi:hypothetical protein